MPIVAEQQGKITPKSALRHRPIGTKQTTVPITQRSTRIQKKEPETRTTGNTPLLASKAASKTEQHEHARWLVLVGISMVATIVLIWMLQMVLAWGTTAYNDLRFGRPRTFQIDAVVGHNDSTATPSHFVAFNLRGHIQILELPGGDASHARMIVGPTLSGDGADLVPVTLQFVDRQGNHHPDMLIHSGAIELWLKNQNGTFVPQ